MGSISEVRQALSQSMNTNAAQPPLEFAIFYTCLTGNIDMAAAMQGYARYMIASEETSLTGFLRFREILQTLTLNPGIESKNLGALICESSGLFLSLYYTSVTVSMLDLTKLNPLLEAYEQFGKEAQRMAAEIGNDFYVEFSRAAHRSERYGVVGGGGGSFEMTDLGDLMENAKNLLPSSSKAVLNALKECVAYNRVGKSKKNSHGVACYYPYSGSMDAFPSYQAGAAGHAVPEFYKQMLSSGSVFADLNATDPGMDGIISQLFESPEVTFYDSTLHISIPKKLRILLTGLDIQVYSIDTKRHTLSGFGRTHSITGDWETGKFTAELTDQWGALNGHLCYMEPVSEGTEISTYHVPILLNGVRHQLVVDYDYITMQYTICGAIPDSSTGAPSSHMTALSVGDRITTLLYTCSYDHSDGKLAEYETFTLDRTNQFRDRSLTDGYYYVPFIVSDFLNRQIRASYVILELRNGQIYVTDLTLENM